MPTTTPEAATPPTRFDPWSDPALPTPSAKIQAWLAEMRRRHGHPPPRPPVVLEVEPPLPEPAKPALAELDPSAYGPPIGRWHDVVTEYEHTHVLRELISANGHAFTKECRKDWYVYIRESGERKVVPTSCNERGHCPACGIAYGRRAAGELVSLVKAALGLLKKLPSHGDVMTFNPTCTYPAEVQAELAARCDAGVYPGKELTVLQDMEKRLLARHIFKTHVNQFTAHVAWHWWNSSNPLSGSWYWHAHLMIPNVTRAGQKLRHEGIIPQDRLLAYKRAKFRWLAKRYPEAMRQFASKYLAKGIYRVWERLNAHVYFVLNNGSDSALYDAAEYDCRHPLKDLLKFVVEHKAWNREDEISAFVARSRWVQKRKTQRYFGWLRPGERIEVGIVPAENDSERWSLEFNAYRTLARFVDGGALFRRYDFGGAEGMEFFSAHQIRLANLPPPRRWRSEPKSGGDPP